MPIIELETTIKAPIERCFDLSRSIDLHKISAQHAHEEAIGGVTSGLINLHEFVTWRARHFGFNLQLTTRITEIASPGFFVDEMVSGVFRGFRHEHHYKPILTGTLMTDVFDYLSPLGILGKLVDVMILKSYMTRFLVKRNKVIKEFAESEKWKSVLQY